jgi:CubicO group peptidase (beta-lactamase class C family)|tara:strand:- start:73 stop:1218 length:1146 start_codon:yes stop_codon:yes gene_type:complete
MTWDNIALNGVLARYTRENLVPGALGGVVDRQGDRNVGAAGYASLENEQPMKEDTIIGIASMTKPVTTVALLQLVEQGKVDLDAPFTDYVADDAPRVLTGFDDEGSMVLADADAIPTSRQLLSHTSGYVYEIWNENMCQALASGQVASMLSGMEGLRVPLCFSPGERWEYGIGIDWAGKIVEAISGKGIDVYFNDHIFQPLGMSDTAYAVPEDKHSRLASVYIRTPDGYQVGEPFGSTPMGGGGLNSTVADYLTFIECILNGGSLGETQILQPDTVDSMFVNQIGAIDVLAGESYNAELSNTFDMGFGSPAKWGLGFLLHTEGTAAGRAPGSGSWAGLFNSYFWIDPASGVGGVVATQVLPFFDDNAVAMLQDFEKVVYQS